MGMSYSLNLWALFFGGLPALSSIFSVISWSIYKILVPILVQISWIFRNTPSFLNFDVFEWSYGRKKENLQFRKWANLSHPWKSSFFKIWNLCTFFLFLWIKSTKMKVRPYFAMQKVQKLLKTPWNSWFTAPWLNPKKKKHPVSTLWHTYTFRL